MFYKYRYNNIPALANPCVIAGTQTKSCLYIIRVRKQNEDKKDCPECNDPLDQLLESVFGKSPYESIFKHIFTK